MKNQNQDVDSEFYHLLLIHLRAADDNLSSATFSPFIMDDAFVVFSTSYAFANDWWWLFMAPTWLGWQTPYIYI